MPGRRGSRIPATMAAAVPVYVWFNGRVMSTDAARVSPFDHGLLVGDGAFETLVAHGGIPFARRRHWDRLRASCECLGIETPPLDVVDRGMEQVIAANGMSDARIRVTVTSGEGPLGSDKGDHPPTCLIAAAPLKPWPDTENLVVVPWVRNERGGLAGVKSISYAENVRALAFAKARGGGEAIFANTRGELCEGTGTNIFLVGARGVVTPPLSSGCLAGVTRGLVIELCRQHGIPIREDPVPMAALADCGEAFLTSTTRGVQAVGRIDARILAAASRPVVERVKELYRGLTDVCLDP